MTDAQTMTINYARVLEERPRAIKFDIGEKRPLWLQRSKVTVDPDNYTVSGSAAMLRAKLDELRSGQASAYQQKGNERVKLPSPAWSNHKSVRIDVLVSSLSGGGKVKKSIFFPKSQIVDGTAPRWLVEKNEKAVKEEVAAQKRVAVDQLTVKPFTDTGLLGELVTVPEMSDPEPDLLSKPASLSNAWNAPST